MPPSPPNMTIKVIATAIIFFKLCWLDIVSHAVDFICDKGGHYRTSCLTPEPEKTGELLIVALCSNARHGS